MDFKPTNFSDYLSRRSQPSIANDYEAQRNGAWAGLGVAAIAGLISLGIPHQPTKPAYSFQNWARLGMYAIVLSGGVFTAHKASRMQYLQSRWQALQQAENQTFGNAIGSAVHHQAALDTAYHRAAVQEHFVQEETPARSLPPDREEESSAQALPESADSLQEYDLDYSYESDTQYFDWNLFDKQSDKYAHIAIVGGTGDGKSFTAENVSAILSGLLLVSHPHRKPSDYPNIKAIHCGGRNYGEWKTDKPVNFKELIEPSPNSRISFASLVKTLELEMDRRYKLYEKGDENYPMVNVILDEMNTCLAKIPEAIKGKDAPIKNLIREARKVKLRLIMLLQDDSVEALQIQGEGSIRKCFRYVRLGEFAKVHAKRQKDDFLMQWVAQQKHPILVEEMPAIVVPQKHLFRSEEPRKKSDVQDGGKSDRTPPVPTNSPSPPTSSPPIPTDTPHQLPPRNTNTSTDSLPSPPIPTDGDKISPENLVNEYEQSPTNFPQGLFYGRDANTNLEIFRILKSRGYNKKETILACWRVHLSGTDAKAKLYSQEYDRLIKELEGSSKREIILSLLETPTSYAKYPDELQYLTPNTGIYFVFNDEWELLYVGSVQQGNSINYRWTKTKHQKIPDIQNEISKGRTVYIGWKLHMTKTTEQINAIEDDLAKKYQAKWNNKSAGKGDI